MKECHDVRQYYQLLMEVLEQEANILIFLSKSEYADAKNKLNNNGNIHVSIVCYN